MEPVTTGDPDRVSVRSSSESTTKLAVGPQEKAIESWIARVYGC